MPHTGGDNKDVGASAPSGKKSAAGLASTFTDSNFVSVDQHAEDNEYEDSLRTDSSARGMFTLPQLSLQYCDEKGLLASKSRETAVAV